MELSRKAQRIEASVTLAITAKAKENLIDEVIGREQGNGRW